MLLLSFLLLFVVLADKHTKYLMYQIRPCILHFRSMNLELVNKLLDFEVYIFKIWGECLMIEWEIYFTKSIPVWKVGLFFVLACRQELQCFLILFHFEKCLTKENEWITTHLKNNEILPILGCSKCWRS